MQVESSNTKSTAGYGDRLATAYVKHCSLEDNLAKASALISIAQKETTVASAFDAQASLKDSVEKCSADSIACLRLFSPKRTVNGSCKGLETMAALYALNGAPAERVVRFLAVVASKLSGQLSPALALAGGYCLRRLDPAAASAYLCAYAGTLAAAVDFPESSVRVVHKSVCSDSAELREALLKILRLAAECNNISDEMGGKGELSRALADPAVAAVFHTQDAQDLQEYARVCACKQAEEASVVAAVTVRSQTAYSTSPQPAASTSSPVSASSPSATAPAAFTTSSIAATSTEANTGGFSWLRAPIVKALFGTGATARWRVQAVRVAAVFVVALCVRLLLPALLRTIKSATRSAHSSQSGRRVLTL